MAHITVRRNHSLGLQEARDAAERIAGDLKQKFDLAYQWNGNALHFQRSGVTGQMAVDDNEVHVEVTLGLLLRPLKGHFEQEIHRHMDALSKKA
jgi:putative polyhydroxyalkanoate system protein